jgi:ATP-dependent DNA helicase RecG
VQRTNTFQNQSNGFLVTEFNNRNKKVVEKVVEHLTHNQNQIIKLIEQDISVSSREISEKIGISTRKVQENIAKLKNMGFVKRIGPAKGGFLEIIKKLD